MRKPTVFVRELRPDEGRRLQQISRNSKQFWRRQRAAILLASATGMSPRQIAELVRSDESHVRAVIHEFNHEGFDSLRPRGGAGRPRRFDDEVRDRIVAIALAPPQTLGVPLTRWSLRKLRDHLIESGVVEAISIEHLRRILKERKVSYQKIRTWKVSNDPDYQRKALRIVGLYRRAEGGRLKDAAVVCFDENGPLSLRPWPVLAGLRSENPSGCGPPSPAPTG